MEDVNCDNLDAAIDQYKAEGFRLDMIFPADSPREALVSRIGETVRLRLSPKPQVPGPTSDSEWIRGRAGMEYRDLIPGRADGRVIASHIRLTRGGEVPDYVHYHKVEFQMIYCKKGRIRVVYEDQGPPFWLETGDCVLQPPEIRHRVLECTSGAEVIEVSMPAEHETWVEHDMTLPTIEIKPDRDFAGQRFIRHIAADGEFTQSEFAGVEARDTGISIASNGLADVRLLKKVSAGDLPANTANEHEFVNCFPLDVDTALLVSLKF